MSHLEELRRLVDLQQHEELRTGALRAFRETGDPGMLPLLAMGHAYVGAHAEAEEACAAAAARLNELDLDARVDLAGVYCLFHRIDEAAHLLGEALSTAPAHPLALSRLAWCRMMDDRSEEARLLYQRAAELAPERLPLWSALSRLWLEAGDYGAAQQALDSGVSRLRQLHDDLADTAIAQFTAQFHATQLEIWIAGREIARAEQWIDRQHAMLDEEKWTQLVTTYAALLAGSDAHAAAEEALHEALKRYPQSLPLLSQLAELAQHQGHIGQCIHLLRRAIQVAIELGKPQVAYWSRLSAAYLFQMDDERARDAAVKAIGFAENLEEGDDLSPAQLLNFRLQAKTSLAHAESQAQHFETAEKRYREVLEENPGFVPALQGLGQQYLQCGRIDEAVSLFERVRQIDPAAGYAALINARRFPQDEATLTRLEKIARQPSLEGRIRSGLLLQLAAAWDKRKAYDRAFSLAAEANEASRTGLNYDPGAHRNRCARTRHAFCKELYEFRRGCGVDSTLPVYIVGMPRSGTTLVEQIIAGHSRIFGAGELGVIPSRIHGLDRWERHTGSGRHYPDCIDDLTPAATASIANGILAELREFAPEAAHVVDKLPHNFENIGFIKFLFPKAKIISVRRDPRDIALSNYFTDYQAKHGGMGFAYDLTDIGEQLADHNLLMYHWHRLFPGEILEIDYEEVVDHTEDAARRMLDYLGVEWEPQVLAFDRLERPVKTASVWQVRQPIYKTSKAKWERYRNHLAPLIKGTNAAIEWDPIEMVTLPEAGLLTEGVELYERDQLDEAEYRLKKLLHHLPDHAAANFMLGLIYLRKGSPQDGVALMERGFGRCPWNPHWRADLIRAYEMVGETAKAAPLKQGGGLEVIGEEGDESMDLPATTTSVHPAFSG